MNEPQYQAAHRAQLQSTTWAGGEIHEWRSLDVVRCGVRPHDATRTRIVPLPAGDVTCRRCAATEVKSNGSEYLDGYAAAEFPLYSLDEAQQGAKEAPIAAKRAFWTGFADRLLEKEVART